MTLLTTTQAAELIGITTRRFKHLAESHGVTPIFEGKKPTWALMDVKKLRTQYRKLQGIKPSTSTGKATRVSGISEKKANRMTEAEVDRHLSRRINDPSFDAACNPCI